MTALLRRGLPLLLALTLFVPPSALPARAELPATELSCFINHTWYPVTSFTGIIPQAITEATGMSLSITVAKDQRQLARLLAQGELPDMIYTSTMLERLSDPSVCYSYDELLERYGIDWEIPPELKANALTYSPDGQIYMLLNNYASDEDWQNTASVPMISSLFVRQDMLDEMGVTSIRTLDELAEVLLRVKEEYPDVVPLTFDLVHRFNIFRCYFGMGTLPFLEQADGSWRFYARDERYLDMLRYLNRLYRSGCMIPDSFAATDSSLLYASGRSFAYADCTQNGNITMSNALSRIDPSYRSVELHPLEGSCFDTQGLGWSGVFITRNAKNPEACLRLIIWMYSEEGQHLAEWGREGIDYTLDDNGLPIFSADVLRSVAEGRYNTEYAPWFYFGTSAVIESEGRCALQGDNLPVETYDAIRRQYHILPWMAAALAHLEPECRGIYDLLTTAIIEQENRIILSDSDEAFEKNYQDMLTYLMTQQVETLEAEMTRSIPEQYERYQQRMKGAEEP